MAYVVKVGTVPDCCGALVLHQLYKNLDPFTEESFLAHYGYLSGFFKTQGYDTPEKVEAYLKNHSVSSGCETLETYKKRLRMSLEEKLEYYKGKRSYALCFLNPKEKEYGAEEIVLSVGFEVLIPETRNPNGSAITLYIYHLLPKKVEEVKSILEK